MVILYISTTCISNPQKTNAGIFALNCLVYFKEIKRKKCFSFNQDIYHLYWFFFSIKDLSFYLILFFLGLNNLF